MGIPYFFGWIKRTFPECVSIVRTNNLRGEGGRGGGNGGNGRGRVRVQHLYVDANAVVHPCARDTYFPSSIPAPPRSYLHPTSRGAVPGTSTTTTAPDVAVVVTKVMERLDAVMEVTTPTVSVEICLDGPLPAWHGKVKQQRARRFRNMDQDQETRDKFDSNCISPGTMFMHVLSSQLKTEAVRRAKRGSWRHLDLYFSDEKCPSEGEHKLIRRMRSLPWGSSACVYSPDGDVILLCLLCFNVSKCFIVKENFDRTDEHVVIDIGLLRRQLVNYLLKSHPPLHLSSPPRVEKCNNNNAQEVLLDFVFMMGLAGNDFLPCILCTYLGDGGMDVLVDTYRQVARTDPNCHFTQRTLEGRRAPRWDGFGVFLNLLAKKEPELLYRRTLNCELFPDPELERHVLQPRGPLDVDAYRAKLYSSTTTAVTTTTSDDEAFSGGREEMIMWFLSGLHWVLDYYSNDEVLFQWQYPFEVAPLAADLLTEAPHCLEWIHKNLDPQFPMSSSSSSMDPLLHLVSVLPITSVGLLPFALRGICQALPEYFPTSLVVAEAGKKNAWEAVAQLPLLDSVRVEQKYRSLVGHLVGTRYMALNAKSQAEFLPAGRV